MPTLTNFNSNSDWQTLSPVSRATPLRSNIIVDVIYADDFITPDVSHIINQYNFTVVGKFTLWKIPVKPWKCSFLMAIKFRRGSNVTRYRLFDNVNCGGAIRENYTMYVNELIEPNFCIELWSADSAKELDDAITFAQNNKLAVPVAADVENYAGTFTLQTSLVRVPTNLRESGSTELSVGSDAGSQLISIDTLLPIDTTIGAWLDNI